MGRIIKRYENRKLYDTESRKYVSLEELARLIRNGADVQIIDKSTGNDITTQTLTQVILEEGKKGRNPLSTEVLHDMIRWGNNLIDDGLQQVRQSFDQWVPDSLSKLLGGGSRKEDIDQLKDRIASLETLILKLARQNDAQDQSKSDK